MNLINCFKTSYLKENQHQAFKFALIIIGLIVFVYTLLDFTLNYPHLETYQLFAKCSLSNGPSLKLKDFITGLNPCLDGNTDRTRFYSWYGWIINTKIRYYLFQYVPYLPSFSVFWIFTFTLLPIYLYKLVFNFTNNKSIAFYSTYLLFFTQGFLSVHTMYFHTAKPMALVCIAACLYYTDLIFRDHLNGVSSSSKRYFILFFALVLSLFWDEMFYTYFLVAPFWYTGLFFKRSTLFRLLSVWFCAFIVFCFVTHYLVPSIIMEHFNYKFNFWNYAFSSNGNLLKLSSNYWWYNFHSSISVHIDAFSASKNYSWGAGPLNSVVLFLFGVLVLWSLKEIPTRKNNLKMLAGMLIFYFFECLILMRREGHLIYGAFYWGAPFSLFFCLWFGTFLTTIKQKFLPYVAVTLLIYFSITGLINNYQASIGHLGPNLQHPTIVRVIPPNGFGKISFGDVFSVWKKRRNLNEAKEIIKALPANAYWLYYESYFQANRGILFLGEDGSMVETIPNQN